MSVWICARPPMPSINGSRCLEILVMSPTRIMLPTDKIAEFCRKNRVKSLAVFGSVLRADFRSDSDIDVLVEFERDAKGWVSRDGPDAARDDGNFPATGRSCSKRWPKTCDSRSYPHQRRGALCGMRGSTWLISWKLRQPSIVLKNTHLWRHNFYEHTRSPQPHPTVGRGYLS